MIKFVFFTKDINQVATFHYYEMLRREAKFNIKVLNPIDINNLKKFEIVFIPPYNYEYSFNQRKL